MSDTVFIHGVENIGDFEYTPSNSHCVGFTLFKKDGDQVNFTIWGLVPEKAKEFYENNTECPNSDKQRIAILERALERIAYENLGIQQVVPLATNVLTFDPNYEYVPL